jgi:hypothetical protein
MRASGSTQVSVLLSMTAIVAVQLPAAVAQEARSGLAGVFRACRITFLAMLVLHSIYYRHKETEDGHFRHTGVTLGAAGGRAPGA